MSKISENEIELFNIDLLKSLGYDYIYAPEYKQNLEDVLLRDRLQKALVAINPTLDDELISYAIKEINRIH